MCIAGYCLNVSFKYVHCRREVESSIDSQHAVKRSVCRHPASNELPPVLGLSKGGNGQCFVHYRLVFSFRRLIWLKWTNFCMYTDTLREACAWSKLGRTVTMCSLSTQHRSVTFGKANIVCALFLLRKNDTCNSFPSVSVHCPRCVFVLHRVVSNRTSTKFPLLRWSLQWR